MSSTKSHDLILTRLIGANRDRVWAALTTPEEASQWWGPKGYTITTHEMDVRVGGRWRFIMHGPDGTDYNNRHSYQEVIKPEKLVSLVDSDVDNDPHSFVSTITLAAEGDKTRITMRLALATAEQKAMVEGFGAVELGYQTLAKLEAHVTDQIPSLDDVPQAERFEISRLFDAPVQKVFDAWTDKKHLEKWWSAGGMMFGVENLDLVPGGTLHYSMDIPNAEKIYGRFTYVEITPPKKLVFLTSFSDAKGGVTRNPMSVTWPLETLSVCTFEPADGKTKLTVTGGAWKATDEERSTYIGGFESMKQGFGSTWDKLAEYLSQA